MNEKLKEAKEDNMMITSILKYMSHIAIGLLIVFTIIGIMFQNIVVILIGTTIVFMIGYISTGILLSHILSIIRSFGHCEGLTLEMKREDAEYVKYQFGVLKGIALSCGNFGKK